VEIGQRLVVQGCELYTNGYFGLDLSNAICAFDSITIDPRRREHILWLDSITNVSNRAVI
jgi:hypothetical protein